MEKRRQESTITSAGTTRSLIWSTPVDQDSRPLTKLRVRPHIYRSPITYIFEGEFGSTIRRIDSIENFPFRNSKSFIGQVGCDLIIAQSIGNAAAVQQAWVGERFGLRICLTRRRFATFYADIMTHPMAVERQLNYNACYTRRVLKRLCVKVYSCIRPPNFHTQLMD